MVVRHAVFISCLTHAQPKLEASETLRRFIAVEHRAFQLENLYADWLGIRGSALRKDSLIKLRFIVLGVPAEGP
jgi:hypothetical protein